MSYVRVLVIYKNVNINDKAVGLKLNCEIKRQKKNTRNRPEKF